ncbi:MAG: InlB B-repeat-containing protein [Bacilli bacterium]|jgi:uncharacterized repeat protein (TIGR02543 family)
MKRRGFLISLITFMMISLTSCFKLAVQHKIHKFGYYEYIITGVNKRLPRGGPAVVRIIGLTQSGLQQSVLDIPRTINDLPVVALGYGPMKSGGFPSPPYTFSSKNLRKLYIHDNLVNIERGAFSTPENQNEFVPFNIMICAYRFEQIGEFNLNQLNKRFIYRYIFENRDIDSNIKWGNSAIPANVEFLNNYSDEVNGGYYRLDNIEDGELIPIPPDPFREGYIFDGWYSESECTNKFDFDIAPTIAENTELKIYAKWISA